MSAGLGVVNGPSGGGAAVSRFRVPIDADHDLEVDNLSVRSAPGSATSLPIHEVLEFLDRHCDGGIGFVMIRLSAYVFRLFSEVKCGGIAPSPC